MLQVIAICALFQSAWAYWDLSPEEQVALENMLAGAGGGYYDDAYNPETRNEDPNSNKPVIPPNTAVAGGAGEGKQHLGPNLIPNKQRIVPEISPPVYDNPPNPCPSVGEKKHTIDVESETKADMNIVCKCQEGWEREGVDCVEAQACCIPNMPNEASFVEQFQQVGQATEEDNDIFQNIYSKRSRYHQGEKKAGHVAKKSPVVKRGSNFVGRTDEFNRFRPQSKLRMDRRNKYFQGGYKSNVVAKKSPELSGAHLPVM